jgi:CheY-like chemotaxis protein
VVGLEADQRAADGGPYRLLVVEDEAANRQLLVDLIVSLGAPPEGFAVREATNGEEAIEIWEQWHPHLIWMDMRIPIMDGLEVTRRIKATPQGQETIIVALTAFAFEEDRARILSEGCDDFVRKPFRRADIFEVLARHLNVRFRYEGMGGQKSSEKEVATKQVDIVPLLAAMPSAWLDELRRAALEGDLGWMTTLTAQIPELAGQRDHDDELAATLTELMERFAFDEIMRLIRNATEN